MPETEEIDTEQGPGDNPLLKALHQFKQGKAAQPIVQNSGSVNPFGDLVKKKDQSVVSSQGYQPTQEDLQVKKSFDDLENGFDKSQGGSNPSQSSQVNQTGNQLVQDIADYTKSRNQIPNSQLPGEQAANRQKQQFENQIQANTAQFEKEHPGSWSNFNPLLVHALTRFVTKPLAGAAGITRDISGVLPGTNNKNLYDSKGNITDYGKSVDAGNNQDYLGRLILGLDSYNNTTEQEDAENPLPRTFLGNTVGGLVNVAPTAGAAALFPEGEVSSEANTLTKLKNITINPFTKIQAIQGGLNNYDKARQSGMSPLKAVKEAAKGAVQEGGQAAVYNILGHIGGEVISPKLAQGLEDAGVVKNGKLTKMGTDAVTDAVVFSAYPIASNLVQGKPVDWNEVESGGGTGLFFGMLKAGKTEGEFSEADQQLKQGVALKNFLDASPDAIEEAYKNNHNPADLQATAVDYAAQAKKATDLEKRQQLIAASSTYGKLANVKSMTQAIMTDPQSFIDSINQSDFTPEEKSVLIDKVQQVYKSLDPLEQKKQQLGQKITQINNDIANIAEQEHDNPVSQAEQEVAIDRLTKAKEQSKKELTNTINQQHDEAQETQQALAIEVPKEPQEVPAQTVNEEPKTNVVEPSTGFFKLGDQDEFYHASPTKRVGELREGEAPQFGKGIYFSTNKDLVMDEFGKELTKVNLSIKKPLYTGTKEEDEVGKLAAYNWNRDHLTYDKEDEVWRDKNGRETMLVSESDLGEKLPVRYFSDAAKELGYDAIIDRNSHTYDNEIVVLDPKKIHYKEDNQNAVSQQSAGSVGVRDTPAVREGLGENDQSSVPAGEGEPTETEVPNREAEAHDEQKVKTPEQGAFESMGVQMNAPNTSETPNNLKSTENEKGNQENGEKGISQEANPEESVGNEVGRNGHEETMSEGGDKKSPKLTIKDNQLIQPKKLGDKYHLVLAQKENGNWVIADQKSGIIISNDFEDEYSARMAYSKNREKLTPEKIEKSKLDLLDETPKAKVANLSENGKKEVDEALKPNGITADKIRDYERSRQEPSGLPESGGQATSGVSEAVQPPDDESGGTNENTKGEAVREKPVSKSDAVDQPEKSEEEQRIEAAHKRIDEWVKRGQTPGTYSSFIPIPHNLIIKWAGEIAKLAATTGIKIDAAFKKWREDNPDFLDNFKGKNFNENAIHKEILSKAKDAHEASEGANPFKELKNIWLGNVDVANARANSEAANFQDEIQNTAKKGQNWKDIDQAIHVYLDLKRNPAHLNEYYDNLNDNQKKIVDLSQNLTDEQKEIANRISKQYQLMGQSAKDAGLINDVLDNYVSRAWDMGGKSMESMRKFGLSTRHSLQRSLDTILEGWAKGYDLKIKGATNNLAILKQEIANVIENRNLIDEGSKTPINEDGDKLFITHEQDGYTKIDHPTFKKWGFAGKIDADQEGTQVMGKRKGIIVTDDGTILEKKDVYAPNKIATEINNIIGTSRLKNIGGKTGAVIDALRKANSFIKQTVLSTSLFHHLAFARNRFLSGEFTKGLNYKDGVKAIKEMTPEYEILVRNGLTSGKIQDWDEAAYEHKGWITNLLSKNNVTKGVADNISDLADRQKRFLFEQFGAGMKAIDAIAAFKREMAKNPYKNPNDVAAVVADAMNNNYGGINLKRINRNPTAQDILHFALLAPDWTESNLRMAKNAFKGGYEGDFARRMWAKVFLRGAITVASANLALALLPDPNDKSGDPIERMKERYARAWKEGRMNWMNINISPLAHMFGANPTHDYYLPLFGHYSDPIRLASSIVDPKGGGGLRFFVNKGSVITKVAGSALTAEDWKGYTYTSADELLGIDDKGTYSRYVPANDNHPEHFIGESKGGQLEGKLTKFNIGGSHPVNIQQIPSFIGEQFRGTMPTQIQNAWEWGSGETDGFTAIVNSIGLGVRQAKVPKEKEGE